MTYNKIITPNELWQDFDTEKPAEILYKAREEDRFESDVYEILWRAFSEADGSLDIASRLYIPSGAKDVIILTEDTEGLERVVELERALRLGCAVMVVDYSDMHNWGTKFPESLSYGTIEKRGDRMARFEHTPYDSCQFLYARILSRAISVAKELFEDGKVIVWALGDSAEFCIQGVAMDKHADGLIIVNGNTYEEYNDLNRYDDEKPELSQEMLIWLSSVSAIAYVKHLDCPVLSVSGSNSLDCDPDRLEDFFSSMKESLTILVRAGERNALDQGCFATISKWIEGIRAGRTFPTIPTAEVKVYDGGSVAVSVKADSSSMIESTTVYYAFNEKNRRFRFYKKCPTTCISMAGEYMANFKLGGNATSVFVYATVNYLDGLSISSFMNYEPLPESHSDIARHNVVLSGAKSYDEFEIDRNSFLLIENEKKIITTGLGLKGVAAKNGGLRTFSVNDGEIGENASILQMDFYSEKQKMVVVEIEKCEDGILTKYSASAEIGGSTKVFIPVRFSPSDFKTKDRIPLEDFNDLKSLSILTPGVGVGNILFV